MKPSSKKMVDASTQTDESYPDPSQQPVAINPGTPRGTSGTILPPAGTAPKNLPFHPHKKAPVPHHGKTRRPGPKPSVTGAWTQPPTVARAAPAKSTTTTTPAMAGRTTIASPTSPPPRRTPSTAHYAPWKAPPKRVVEKFEKASLPVDKEEFDQDTKRLGLRVGLHRSRHA